MGLARAFDARQAQERPPRGWSSRVEQYWNHELKLAVVSNS